MACTSLVVVVNMVLTFPPTEELAILAKSGLVGETGGISRFS